MTTRFDWRGVVARVLFSFFIVFAVYNPSGHSLSHWVIGGEGGLWLKLTVSLAMLGLHGLIWITVAGVLKWKGVLLLLATIFAGWMAAGDLATGAPASIGIATTMLVSLALLYAAGLSYSHIHHRLAGIAHVDNIH